VTSAIALDPRFPKLRPEVVQGYLDAPAHMLAEILGGELVLMARPTPRYQGAAGALHGDLRGPFHLGRGGPGGWVLLPEVELH
jgi:hypothetical protein